MNERTNKILRNIAILGLVALVPLLAACSKAAPATSAGGTKPAAESPATGASSSGAAAQSTSNATIKLLEPTDGAKVAAGTVKVKVETSGIKFVMPSTTNVAGEGHVHFMLDDRPVEMSAKPEAEFKDVAPGVHKLKAELVQNDATSFNPSIEEEIEFTAK